ncbi:FMN-binding negative transcriptional regulator [Alicyclobacillus dauci]|uniref:FMN-binding negative transcriptional regulator n=1 Tax=Alicyclobacillus dauci TaxID=1475485 RepID=A0ABY6YZ28_9BACL|nr:FMN-binding negative transcriptional regulator [Alicyclobacillus dauci]WAH35231.1 FMN-binding negative transcriptional regulator [Alicyclobacillus dauci]
MYIPKSFEMNDSSEIDSFIQTHSFGMLVSICDERPVATHVPFIYDPERHVLLGHMAKANPQWRNIDGQTVLVTFSGPHAYISPSWYEVSASVPTWNYVAVHVYGTCAVIENEDELASLLDKTIRFYEPDSELLSQANDPFYRNMMKAIVGVKIHITSVQGAAKLSQNKPSEVQQRVITKLRQYEDHGARSVARLMQARLDGTTGGGHTGE